MVRPRYLVFTLCCDSRHLVLMCGFLHRWRRMPLLALPVCRDVPRLRHDGDTAEGNPGSGTRSRAPTNPTSHHPCHPQPIKAWGRWERPALRTPSGYGLMVVGGGGGAGGPQKKMAPYCTTRPSCPPPPAGRLWSGQQQMVR